MSSKTFTYDFEVKKYGSGSYKIIAQYNAGSPVTLTDTPDNTSDNLTVLGDIANDHYSTTINGTTFANNIYFGTAVNQSGSSLGVLGIYYGRLAAGIYNLYTDQKLANGTAIKKVAEPYTICFGAGTRIRTVRGDVPVETLAVGDLVVTASGAQRPVKWLGHRPIDCRKHSRPAEVMPVRIAAHALGENRPQRDLLVSPGHSICLDLVGELLIPAFALWNGATIAQVDVDRVDYWHVELDGHDLLLAENLACESYLDMGNRAFFAESEVVDLTAGPDAGVVWPTHADFCRPFRRDGELVDLLRDRLCLRAADLGWRLAVEDELGGLWLEVDGERIVPLRNGLLARASLPAGAREVRICSDAAVPAAIHGGKDVRRLGLQLASLIIDDGLGCRREIACTDPRLEDGFHLHEGTHRWTDGYARLPTELWEGCRDDFYLRLAFAGPMLPRWVAPPTTAAAESEAAAA